jgi:hypothetical protein
MSVEAKHCVSTQPVKGRTLTQVGELCAEQLCIRFCIGSTPKSAVEPLTSHAMDL